MEEGKENKTRAGHPPSIGRRHQSHHHGCAFCYFGTSISSIISTQIIDNTLIFIVFIINNNTLLEAICHWQSHRVAHSHGLFFALIKVQLSLIELWVFSLYTRLPRNSPLCCVPTVQLFWHWIIGMNFDCQVYFTLSLIQTMFLVRSGEKLQTYCCFSFFFFIVVSGCKLKSGFHCGTHDRVV